MKNFLIISLLLVSCICVGQQQAQGTWQNQIQGIYNTDGSTRLVEDKISESERPKYLNPVFQPGSITTIYGETVNIQKMRFNIYDDYLEFVDGKEIKGLHFGGQIVDAQIGLTRLRFVKTESIQGTLVQLYEKNGVAILKKPSVKFIPERPGSGIVGGNVGNFLRAKDKYLLLGGDVALDELVVSKKDLKKLYGKYFSGGDVPKKLDDKAMINLAKAIHK